MVEMDKIDFKILSILQKNNQITNAELADSVGISAPTCSRRVRRLRDERVITADVCIIDHSKIGNLLTIIVEVELLEENTATMKEFERKVVGNRHVKQCYLVTGETDYLLFVSTSSMAEYESFAAEMFFSNPLVKKFKTLIVMSSLKNDTGVDFKDYTKLR